MSNGAGTAIVNLGSGDTALTIAKTLQATTGETDLNGGNVNLAQGFQVGSGGSLSVSGAVVAVSGAGTVAPSANLAINNSTFTLATGSSLTSSGTVTIVHDSTATFNGTVNNFGQIALSDGSTVTFVFQSIVYNHGTIFDHTRRLMG